MKIPAYIKPDAARTSNPESPELEGFVVDEVLVEPVCSVLSLIERPPSRKTRQTYDRDADTQGWLQSGPTVKIGPIGSSDIELSVCYLPQQIIGEPKLARSANDHSGSGRSAVYSFLATAVSSLSSGDK